MNPPPAIHCRNISVARGQRLLLDGLNLFIHPCERVALTGPSGAGKSTFLRAVAGLEPITAGEIDIEGEPASTPGRLLIPPHRRGVGMVLQDLGLWPTFSALEHLLVSPRPAGRTRADHLVLAKSLLIRLGLEAHSHRKPGTLSGGEQQRIALGSAFMAHPGVLLLDEPFQSLDLLLKRDLLDMVGSLASEIGCAIILVTHDISEAASLGTNRVVFIESGKIALSAPWEALSGDEPFAQSATAEAWRKVISGIRLDGKATL